MTNINNKIFGQILFYILLTSCVNLADGRALPYLGIRLEGYQYPYSVNYFNLEIEGHRLQMAYMDVPPSDKPLNKIVVLLHGGLAMSAYWKETINFLSEHGYRVIVPDQIGFGKSSKENVHYNLHLLAKNTNKLLNHLGIHQKVTLVGHSFGGMIAIRFTLMYPEKVDKLVLEDPLGLEDYRLKIPFKSIDELISISEHPTLKGILNTHHALYAVWSDKYAKYAEVAYRVSLNPKYKQIAMVQALIYEMIYSEPIVYELHHINVPTLLVFGYQDHTAPGKEFVSENVQKTLEDFPTLVKNAASLIPNITVKGFNDVGHVPHLEVPEKFNRLLVKYLSKTY